jgi:hypothetical protein
VNGAKATAMAQSPSVDTAAKVRAANVRTAAILFAIAFVFFVGFIASRFMGDSATGMTVIGVAVLLFLVVAIGRNLRSKR